MGIGTATTAGDKDVTLNDINTDAANEILESVFPLIEIGTATTVLSVLGNTLALGIQFVTADGKVLAVFRTAEVGAGTASRHNTPLIGPSGFL